MPLLTSLPGDLRRRVLVHRRPLAALLAALTVLAGLQVARSPGPATVPVWAVARDLPAGAVLAPGDLTRVGLPPDRVPAGAVSQVRRVLGRTVAAPLRRGTPLTDLAVVARPLVAAYPGRVATPVRLADSAVVDLLRVGDVVDVVAADPQGSAPARTVSTGATVVAIPRADGNTADVGLPGRLVLLAVPEGEAADVSAAGVTGYLTVTLGR